MATPYALNGRSILVVEDDPLIALELAALFQSAGAQVLSLRTLAEAAAAVAQGSVCAAVLDYRLGDDNVATLCEALGGRRIPFVLYSGYSDLQENNLPSRRGPPRTLRASTKVFHASRGSSEG